MKKIFQLGLLFVGALALSLTLATAEGKCDGGKCGNATKEVKCNSGKCGNATKEVKCNSDKCGGDTKKEKETKPAPAKGKCGQGKCG